MLIDYQEVRHSVCNIDRPDGVTEEQFNAVMGEVCGALERIKPLPAVPLAPLCAWLAGYAIPPRYALEAIGEPVITSEEQRAKAWEYHFRALKLLES